MSWRGNIEGRMRFAARFRWCGGLLLWTYWLWICHEFMKGQHVVPSITDCTPKPVQHRPSCLIRAKPEYSMQRFGGNAIFSGSQVPSCGKPNGKRSSGAMEYRSRCSGYAIAARIAPPSSILHTPTLGTVARWASEDTLATNPVQVVKAGGIIVKPRQKLGVVARIVNPGLCRNRPDLRYAWFHSEILTLPY
jgi:hypothetical protein